MKIADKIISIIRENTECKLEIDRDTNFINELKIDSFGRLMIIYAIEDEYSIEIDENDIENFKTVNQIVAALELKYILILKKWASRNFINSTCLMMS